MLSGSPAEIVLYDSIVYDSQGFEPPTFSTDDLTEQDPDAQAGPWVRDGAGGSATVQTTVVLGGNQAVQVDRVAEADDRWAVVTLAPTTPSDTVVVEWDMRVDAQTAVAGTYGPFMGVEAYDTNATFALLGALYVDATTGDLITLDSNSFATETGYQATLGTWHHYEIQLDFTSETYTVLQDDIQVDSRPFVDLGEETITSVSYTHLRAHETDS